MKGMLRGLGKNIDAFATVINLQPSRKKEYATA